MTQDSHAKRRLTNRPHKSGELANSQTGPEHENLEDVTNILDELEGLSENREASLHTESSIHESLKDAAPLTDVSEFSIDQLEAELEDAIASELGSVEDVVKETLPPEQVSVPAPVAAPTVRETEPLHQTAQATEIAEHSTEFLPAPKEHRPVTAKFVAPFAAPIEKLSARDRFVVNMAVLSLALWVPVVWFLAVKENPGLMGLTSHLNDQSIVHETH